MPMMRPPHPGQVLRGFIEGLREESGHTFTIAEVAEQLRTTPKTLSLILNGRQSVTPEMALRLAAAFPNSAPENWLKMQQNYDLAKARKETEAGKVRPLWTPPEAGKQTMTKA